MPAKPRLLYLSPVMPKPGGNGLAMRAAMMIDALARLFDIDLFVFPVAGAVEPHGEFVRERAARIGGADPRDFLDTHFAFIDRVRDPDQHFAAALAYPKPALTRFCTPASAEMLAAWTSSRNYAAIHVMRLYLAPLLAPLYGAATRPRIVLDLDDDDATYQAGLGALCEAAGDHRGSLLAAAEAQKYRSLAATHIPKADLCLTAATADRDRYATLFPGVRFLTIANACLPAEPQRPSMRSPDELRLLFIGTLGYPPNADAAILLIRDVLPELQRRSLVPVFIDIVGAGAPDAVTTMAANPAVTVHGFVETLAPLYAAADIVAVPLRFGGGTPIKLLEGFAYRRPVVATRFAAAGLKVVDGEHLLLADDAEGFAVACLRLWGEAGLAAHCIERAAALLGAEHHPERIAQMVADAYSVFSVE